jgi:hypothetical protein
MSEAISTPAAPVSTPSAPAASPAPAAAPAGASAPVTSAPEAAPVTTEAAPVVETPATPSDAGKSTLQIMQEAQAKKDAEAKPAAEPVAEVPAPVVEEKTPEQIAEDEAAATAAASETEPKTDEEDDDLPNFDDFELDPIALAPKELATEIETDPALTAALEANPELKNKIFANARLAAETAQFKEIFGSPAEAKVAAEGHAKFASIAGAMGSIKDGDTTSVRPVMQQMLEASALRGPDGQLQYDKDKNLITDGSVGKFLRSSFQQRIEMFAEKFAKDGDEDGQAAVDILMERAGLRAPSSASNEEMSEATRTELATLQAERAQLAQEKQERATETATTYNSTVNTKIDAMMDIGINSILSRATGLNDFTRKIVEKNIRVALQTQISKNPQFQTEMDRLEKMPYGKERQKEHMALATRYFQTGLAKVAQSALTEAGASLTAKQKAQADKSAARTEAARSETRGAVATTKSAPALSEHETLRQVETDLRAKLGRSPSNLELMQENLLRKSRTAA